MITEILYKILKWVIKRVLTVDGEWVDWKQLSIAVATTLGCAPICLDQKYKLITLDDWKEIIKSDTLNITKEWKQDVFDCDNFAITFNAHCAEFYEVNTAGIALGKLYDAYTLEFLGNHAFNVLVAKKDNQLKLYVYEPQTDELAEASKKTKVGDKIYEVEAVIFG